MEYITIERFLLVGKPLKLRRKVNEISKVMENGQSALDHWVSSFFPPPVGRNTVGLSARRHSTAAAAALAQNAAPDTQENRWDDYAAHASFRKRSFHWHVNAAFRKSPSFGCIPFFPCDYEAEIDLKKIKNPHALVLAARLWFFVVLGCVIHWSVSDWSPGAKYTPTWRHFLFSCFH